MNGNDTKQIKRLAKTTGEMDSKTHSTRAASSPRLELKSCRSGYKSLSFSLHY